MVAEICPSCGRRLDLHDRHVRFTLPDPVFDVPEREAVAGMWMSHGTALRLGGRLANAIRPWGLLGAPVETVVHDPDETPYCDSSDDPDPSWAMITDLEVIRLRRPAVLVGRERKSAH